MSRKHRNECSHDEEGFNNCCCSFPTLVILILIILQFNRSGRLFGLNTTEGIGGSNGSFETVDNSILFIIAIFYLSCCNPCKR